jgi:hypothetical protein
VLPDEYQDAASAGSLVQARRCWLDLMNAASLPYPQRFAFDFRCPTERMAVGLVGHLRYADPGSYARVRDPVVTAAGAPWEITGTTTASVWSLPALEHLFMRLRHAGARYESTLEQLTLLPQARAG